MQIYRNKLRHADHAIARRWTFGAVGFYGSILVMMILHAEFGQKSGASLADGHRAQSASVESSRNNGVVTR